MSPLLCAACGSLGAPAAEPAAESKCRIADVFNAIAFAPFFDQEKGLPAKVTLFRTCQSSKIIVSRLSLPLFLAPGDMCGGTDGADANELRELLPSHLVLFGRVFCVANNLPTNVSFSKPVCKASCAS